MSQYYDTTEYMLDGEFDYDEGGMVTDWHEHDSDVEYNLELLNDVLYPDNIYPSDEEEVITEEQQLDLFPKFHLRFYFFYFELILFIANY